MSVTSSAPVFVDPLAQEGPIIEQPRRGGRGSSVTRERAAIVAPNVEGHPGAEAIEIVRSKGLIAAIETVEIGEDGQQGIVIEQDPPADTHMIREGVVTLRVAQTPTEPQGSEDGETPEGRLSLSATSSADGERDDDTAEWFATLRSGLGTPVSGDTSALRRRRKHRRNPVAVTGMVFDTPPSPHPPADELNDQRDYPTHPTKTSVPSGLVGLLVWIPSLSISPTWRRRGLVLVTASLALLIFTRSGNTHLHGRVALPPARVSTLSPRIATLRMTPVAPSEKKVTLTHRGSPRLRARARLSMPRRAFHKSIVATVKTVARAAAARVTPPARPAPAVQSSSSTVAEPTAPFIYLGK